MADKATDDVESSIDPFLTGKAAIIVKAAATAAPVRTQTYPVRTAPPVLIRKSSTKHSRYWTDLTGKAED